MNLSRLSIFAIVLTSVAGIAQAPPAGYKLAWSDEFNGPAVNQAVWTFRTDSKLESTQLPANVTQQNGNLVIALRKQESNGKHFTGGGIITRKTFGYGYYEARLKIAVGSGWHSSFWMQRYNGIDTLGDKATLEMDVIENQSRDLTSYGVNTHRWVPPHIMRGGKRVMTPDLSKDFHVFGCEYSPDLVRYYFDGQLVQTVEWKGEPQGEVNIWLTSIAEAMGPNHSVDDSNLPGAVYVDWVRFYTKDSK